MGDATPNNTGRTLFTSVPPMH
ncbi:hypothetical protein FRAAL2270 [Frankia alni ACN14a]|uniref:Uncharacterized protein n=1 Tax=Frankia alni (strain DSM 45986 / CECT 9034 / ACN14a) TaxID=326424 RepID=Q0RNG9_FRAAA|nr:hypothetical protein FRAAL2270 [Frankia alni ACN14a]